MPQASPVWQTAFLVGSIVCIGWLIFSGWRAGVIRGVISLCAMIFSYMAGSAVAFSIPAGWLDWLPLPRMLAQLLAGLAAGILVFVAIWFAGALLFKRTAQHSSLILRLIWGIGGALCGTIFGVLIVLSILAGVRTLGAFSETRLEARNVPGSTTKPSFWEPALVKLKRSIEAGETGSWMRSVDMTPESTIHIITKLGKILSDPAAAQRFIESPHLTPVVTDRAFVNLIADPDINDAAISGNYMILLTNPKVLEAVRDPVLWQKMQDVDWEAAMDESLISSNPVPDRDVLAVPGPQ